MKRPFLIFLDRDGTVNEYRPYLRDPAQVKLLPNTGSGLRSLCQLGARLVLVTNQAGVGRRYFDSDAVSRVNVRLEELLRQEGVMLHGIYICPHHPNDNCICRKPKPGLLLQAAAEQNLPLQGSFLIGDQKWDIEAGRRAGCTTIQIISERLQEGEPRPDFLARDLLETANIVQRCLQDGHPQGLYRKGQGWRRIGKALI